MKVQVLYDFDGEPGSSELTIRAGETLTVTRQDVGEGWWEGTNQNGKTGLFPAAYAEPVTESTVGDYWDDEWDEDSDGGASTAPSVSEFGSFQSSSVRTKTHSERTVSLTGRNTKAPARPKPTNKSSSFARSGSDSYIFGTLHLPVPEGEHVYINETQYGIMWNPITEHYSCAVASPKKESKLKGLKTFIAYQLTPSFNNIQVSRRYKHFDWLHERLQEKFCLIPIPPLPDKQIAGRYEEQFIERRKNQLQSFVDYVCRHPILSRCCVWQHFITCTNEKKWKAGKRKAEKDELVGTNYFFSVIAPEKPLNAYTTDQETEIFSKYIRGLDTSVKNLTNVVFDQSKKWQNLYKRDYQRLGHSLTTFARAFGSEEQTGYSRAALAEAIKQTGNSYNEIGQLCEDHCKLDWDPLGDMLHIYKGTITSFPEIVTIHKGAIQKRREMEKLSVEGKIEHSQLQDVVKRSDVVSYSLLAEINQFHAEQVTEVNRTLKLFLGEQIAFHKQVVSHLEEALKMYE